MGEPLGGLRILIECRSNEASRERCLRRIWDLYYPRIMVFVGNCRGVASSEIEDLVQEIMEKVFRGIQSYDPAWSFSTWVYTIARHHCIDRARRTHAGLMVGSLSEIPESLEPAHPSTPESELLRREAGDRVKSFLQSADPDTRQMAFLRFHQGMGYRQISSIMGIPVGTVKFRMHRMREGLRSFMEEEDGKRQSAKESNRALPARAF
jgi:RNA polymerase sigma factor (sigma-70 family)